jgi:eukaryotic-like serine/threonine-protein kinase
MAYTLPMIGATLGSYRIIKRLSAGGMGEVYVAEHVLIGRKAAIKLLLPDVSKKPDLVKRFFNEAKATAAIGHPGIVDIFDYGFHDDGRAYITMEFLEGEPLNRRIKRQGKVPLDQAIGILEHVCSALGAAHKKGIVHRDLKPDNIFLVRDPGVKFGERAKLLDFGIAKLTDDESGATQTRTGMVMGTPAYMAPEQCRGAGEVDHRADLYAIGCIFYALLCGRPPFVGLGAGEIIGLQQFMEPPRPSEIEPTVHPAAEALIMKLLEKKPERRVQTTDALAAELAMLSEGTGMSGRRASTSQPYSPRDVTTELPTPEPRQQATPVPQQATPVPQQAPWPQQAMPGPQQAMPGPQQAPWPQQARQPVPTPWSMPQPAGPAVPGQPQYPGMPAPAGAATTPMPRLSQEELAPPGTILPTPAEGILGQSTTLGGAASQPMMAVPVAGSRRWVPITVAASVVAVVGVLVLVMSGGSDGELVAAAVPDVTEADSAVALQVEQDDSREPVGAGAEAAGTVPDEGSGAGAGMQPDIEIQPGGAGEDGSGSGQAKPEMVTLLIESTPAGAAVRLSGSKDVLGTTPYTHQVERGRERLTFTLALEGYGQERVKLATDQDISKHVKLAATSVVQATGKTGKTGKAAGKTGKTPDKTGKTPPDTKDPFGRPR